MAVTPQIRRRPEPESHDGSFPAGMHPVLQRAYRSRGVFSVADNDLSLACLPEPQALKGLGQAVDILAAAVTAGQRILIIGDYDADGATSTAVAMLALRAMGARDPAYLLPDRFRYGYGLSPAIVDMAAAGQPDLIVTVDNGIASHAGIDAAHRHGIRVIVTDHHLPGKTLPAADAIVNPNQPGCGFPSRNLAGVGVIFYTLVALRSRLREQGWFASRKIPEPNLADYLDLVAVGTVADVVPLDAINRILVEQGLRRIRSGQCRPGITALLEVGKRDPARTVASDLGFTAGPRLNAAGRLGDMTEGVRCLLQDDAAVAWQMALELDAKNRERRNIETGMSEDALAGLALGEDVADMPWGLAVFEPHWHQGVVGILASRLKERFHRPVIAFAPGENGELKGSGRSIPGFHMRDALDAMATRHPGLIDRFGGHAMAAGLSIARERFGDFCAAFDALARSWLDEGDLTAILWSDGALAADDMSLALARQLRMAGPWGQKFPEPVFDDVFVVHTGRTLQDKHLKLGVGLPGSTQRLDAIWFNADFSHWARCQQGLVRIAYRLDVNEYRGIESLQLMVQAIQPA